MMSIALLTVGWLAGWWLLWRVPTLPRSRRPPVDGSSVTDVAVVVPARNEAGNVAQLLGSLARQTLQAREIVVVDDGSEDATVAIARDAGATVVSAGSVPAGWSGKSWACQRGADATTAATLVFLDADVRLSPHGLEAVVDALDDCGGLVSVAPRHRMGSPIERLSAPFNLVAFMGVGAARPGRLGRSDGAFGPCMACARRDYEAVGGHASVGASITDDLALARAFDDRNLPTWTFAGNGTVEYRMYPDGFGQLFEGWSKNVASGARFVSALRALFIGLWVTSLLVAVQLVGLALLDRSLTQVVIGTVAFVGVAVQQRVMLSRLTNAGWGAALAFPVTTAFFVAVFARSIWWTVVRRRVHWRGRTLAIARADRPVRTPHDG